MEPTYAHTPVLLAEVLAALQPRPGGCYVDGTLGGGGHAEAILSASAPNGWLRGCDRDGAAVRAASFRLTSFAGRLEIRQGEFSQLADWIPPSSVQGLLLDLGVSSHQLDNPERGFSFQHDGPLDMRMDERQTLTAATLVNTWAEADLAQLFWEMAGERHSRRIARTIVRDRDREPFKTTRQLATLIERSSPRQGRRLHPATRVFQALRMEVNDEMGQLQRGLPVAASLLAPGGRLVIITFHAVEARLIKAFGDAPPKELPMQWVRRKTIGTSPEECAANPRSRSARLRVLERL